MDDLEALKAEVCSLLDNRKFWQAIQTIQNAMMECRFSACEPDLQEESRVSGLTEET